MRHKIIVSVLIFWAFINSLFLVWAYFGRDALSYYEVPGYFETKFIKEPYIEYQENMIAANYLYPIQTDNYMGYDITEFMLYVATPLVLYFLYRYIKGEKQPLLPLKITLQK